MDVDDAEGDSDDELEDLVNVDVLASQRLWAGGVVAVLVKVLKIALFHLVGRFFPLSGDFVNPYFRNKKLAIQGFEVLNLYQYP